MATKQLALSILSADFTQLGKQIQEAEGGGADCFHLDIMDGHFVPNISFGPEVVRQVNLITDKFLDVHLMINDPDRYLKDFSKAGSDLISVHVEACPHLHRTLAHIKDLGCQSGVAVNPATPLAAIEEILPLVDQVILMSVNPGFGGQKFIPETLFKLERLIKILTTRGLEKVVVEFDGGVNQDNVSTLLDCGAKRLVLGSAVFNSHSSVEKNLKKIQSLIS